MTYHPTPTTRLSGSILYTLISLVSLTLITACGGVTLNIGEVDARDTLCKANPYAVACADDPDYEVTRKEVFDGCVADGTTDLCAIVIPLLCDDNPFSAICAGTPEYVTVRDTITAACEAEQTANCDATQLGQFCTANPYQTTRCADEDDYAPARATVLATCGTTAESAHCPVAVDFATTLCTANPFDTLCLAVVGDTYDSARADIRGRCNASSGDLRSQECINAIDGTCVGAGITDYPRLCENATARVSIAEICDTEIFNTACDSSPTYIAQREAFCESFPMDQRCLDVVLNACTANPFDAICLTGSVYVTPRNTAIADCISAPQGTLCDDAIEYACGDNPFHALCSGASAATYNTARQTAVTECGDGTNTITAQLCIDAVELTCEGDNVDVFNALCIAASAQTAQVTACGANPPEGSRCYLQEQIDACADGTEVTRCASVGTGDISTCTADPFAAACVMAGSTFANYLSAAQSARFDYCGGEGVSDTDPRCDSYRACKVPFDASEAVPDGCGSNFDVALRTTCTNTPFDPQCTSDSYDSNKMTFCSINTGGVNNLFHVNCTADYQDASARDTFCRAEPFHDGCKSNAAYADLREGLCTGDAVVTPHASCVTPALGTSPVSRTEVALIPLNTSLRNPVQNLHRYADSFLSVTITADAPRAPSFAPIVRTVVTPRVVNGDGEETSPETTTVEPTTIGFRTVGRRGGEGSSDALNTNPDGYVFFTLIKPELSGCSAENPCPVNTRTSTHAAILPTTNLGAPLTEAPATAVWPGHFSTTETGETAVDFYIDWNLKQIGFSNSAKTGIGFHAATNRPESRPGRIVASQIRLGIKFNNAGVLYDSYAEIRDATTNKGLLRVIGFIGQEGVVAAFIDRFNGGGAGGFTASNPDHSTYVEATVAADESLEETGADSNATLVNYEDWTDSSVSPAEAASTPSKSEFLQPTPFTDNRRGFANLTNGANAQVVDFNSTTRFRSNLLRGDAKNGYAVHTTAGNHYSGVLHTADLGAPIAETQGSAIWRGYLLSRESVTTENAQGADIITTAVTRADFDLTVKFSTSHDGQAGEISGNVHRLTNLSGSGLLYTIEGRFNPRGAISGTIVRTEGLVEADLSGIIGQTGAIAVFVSDQAGNKFAGGFVAVPVPVRNANYATWLATHRGVDGVGGVYGLFNDPIGQNHWLPDGVGAIAHSRKNIIPASLNNGKNTGDINLSTATWKRAALGGSASNGVEFYSGILTGSGRRTYYSGLVNGVDLGRPLAAHSGRLHWVGRLDVLQGGQGGQSILGRHSGDVVLRIDLNQTGGRIKSTFTDDDNNPPFNHFPLSQITSPNHRYDINAVFNEDGFITRGTVTTHNGEGYLSGLIGERGLVAAVVGGHMAGGLVATPTKPSFASVRTTYDDWAHFTGQRFGTLRSLPHNESGQHNAFLHTNTTDGHINVGNIGQDPGREHTGRGAYGVGYAFAQAGLTAPAGLTGGFSWLAGFWDRDSAPESSSTLNRGYHAGLFQNTNVGLPLGPLNHYGTSASTTATWRGWFYAHQNKTFAASVNTSVPFRLLVNYGTRRVSLSYDTTYGNLIGGIYEISDLNGGDTMPFDERGVITGKITHKDAHVPDGDITGLIGQHGLVAVFVSRADSGTKPHYGFTGGFVACPLLTRSQDSGCIR